MKWMRNIFSKKTLPQCDRCKNPDCPMSLASPDPLLRVTKSDLYDLGANLVDRAVLCTEADKAELTPAKPETPRKREKRKTARLKKELELLYDHVHELSEKLARVSVKLDELQSMQAKRKAREPASKSPSEMGALVSAQVEMSGLRARVEELADKALDPAAELKTKIEELSKKLDDNDLYRLSEKVQEIWERFADRDFLSSVSDRVDEVQERSAEREDLAKTRERLEELGESLDKKLVELDEKSADKAFAEELASRQEELKAMSAEKESVEELEAALSNLEASLAAAEEWRRSFEREVSEELKPGLENAASELERLLERVGEVDKEVSKLRPPAEAARLFESRLTALELALSSQVAGAFGEGSPGRGFRGVEEIRSEIVELKKKIKKAFDDSTAFTSGELEVVRNRLAAVEQARAVPERPLGAASIRDRLSSTPRRRLVTAAAAALFILGSLSGAAIWRWSGGGSPGSASLGELAYSSATNVVYDPSEQPLSSPTLDLATERVSLSRGKADVTGYSPGASRAFLYLNNREVDYCEVEEQGFAFRDVPLEYGVNVVEVKVVDEFGNEANSMASILERMSNRVAKVKTTSAINRMRGPRDMPHLALTFDAGASDRRAEKILDILRQQGIVTTFFLTGRFIEKYPAIVKRIVADGHEAGNHTYSHPHLTTFEKNRRHTTAAGITKDKLQQELLKTRRLFESLTGASMSQWWRAPYGEHNREILSWAEEAGFRHVDWTRTPKNHDMLDWVSDEGSRYYLDSGELLARLTAIDSGVAGRANGGIVLMHLGTDRERDFLDKVLPEAIERLRERDYQFVTVSRMFSR